MLDLQRQRSSAKNQQRANYARLVIFSHLVLGALAAGLFVFHQEFYASLATLLWYLLSIGLVVGMCHMRQWCRILLGLWFAAGGLVSLVYVAYLPPVSSGGAVEPALSLQLIPIWLSTAGLAYLAAGAIMILSSRIEQATTSGFALWQPSNPW